MVRYSNLKVAKSVGIFVNLKTTANAYLNALMFLLYLFEEYPPKCAKIKRANMRG